MKRNQTTNFDINFFMNKLFNGKEYRLRNNTNGSTKKQLEKLAKYGKEKGIITSYRIVKEDGAYKLYIR